MRMIAKGFDMVYYMDQMLLKDATVHLYNGEKWAPLNTTHFISDQSYPTRNPFHKYYWCFSVENGKIYCLGLFADDGSEKSEAEVAYKSEFHNVTDQMKEVIKGR